MSSLAYLKDAFSQKYYNQQLSLKVLKFYNEKNISNFQSKFEAMRTMQQWFDEYGESHKNPINKAFHWICVPTIFFTIIGLLSTIPLPFIDYAGNNTTYLHLGSLLIGLGLLFYLRVSFSMFIGMAIFSYLVLFLNKRLDQTIEMNYALFNFILFALAWIGQFIGHKIEGKKPSFLKDVQFLLIGPAWLMGFIYRKIGFKY